MSRPSHITVQGMAIKELTAQGRDLNQPKSLGVPELGGWTGGANFKNITKIGA